MNGSLGAQWGVWGGAGTAFHYEICGDASWYRGRELQAPRNGGLPAKEWLDDNMPRQRLYGAPYRCNCET